MSYERILTKEKQPTNKEILKTIGDTTHWLELRQYLESSYDFPPDHINYGKHGWTIRYRKSGKTLCSLFPEKGAFTVLIVLGKKEAEKATSIMDKFNATVRELLNNTDQLHDGRWLWIRVLEQSDITSIKELLTLKRKPQHYDTPTLRHYDTTTPRHYDT
ncbi:MAG: DUF3788 domain-containing protein, partial [Candidatus Hatepunaea meridiana]|nr:DUF3788 domain-containing protein [Candidatus Hatepunaea meridiana]